MRRNRASADQYFLEEAGHMHMIKIFWDMKELSDLVKKKLSPEDQNRFQNSEFLPVKIEVSDSDLTVNAIFMSTESYVEPLYVKD